MKKWTLRAKIKDEKIIPETPSELYEAKKQLEGENILLVIEKWYARRSNAQNNYYWGVIIDILGFDTGSDKDDLHEFLKQEFSSKKKIFGRDIPSSTSKMSTVQFEEYASNIRRWASRDLGIYIPEPHESPEFAYDVEKEKRKNKIINLDK